MFKLLKRTWKYLVAALTGKLEDLADPRVQIEQAIEEAKRRHEVLSQQAAAVLGNRRQIELQLARAGEEAEKLQGSARQALTLGDQAARAGDTAKVAAYEEAAQAFAVKLVATESTLADLKVLYERATASAEGAKAAVEQNAFALRKQLAERAKLLSQLEHAKLQERMNEAVQSVSELAVPADVPTLDQVRDKIEARYARALGHQEVASESVGARMLEIDKATIDAQAGQRLESLRASLRLPPPAPAVLEARSSPSEDGS